MSALFRFRVGPAWLAALLVLTAGCGRPPQVGAPKNYELVAALRTAVSAHRNDWLENAAQAVAARHVSGEIDDVQFRALEAIVELGRSGDWQGAESEVLRLAQAQRATDAELEPSKGRKAPPHKP